MRVLTTVARVEAGQRGPSFDQERPHALAGQGDRRAQSTRPGPHDQDGNVVPLRLHLRAVSLVDHFIEHPVFHKT